MKADFSLIEGQFNTVAIALSGGSDSMALLHYANANKDLLKIKVIAINVEHGIRGESSLRDTRFVKDYCDKNGIKLLQFNVDSIAFAKDNKLSLEESARLLRYNCFDRAKKAGEFDYLLTAHHQRDNVETILFNLCRGSGLNGLSGIPIKKEYIVRPLLNTKKDDIDAYVKANNIPYVVDETNLSDDYTRNFIRHNVLPKLKEVFIDAESNVDRLSQIVSKENEFLDELARDTIKRDGDKILIKVSTPEVLFRRAMIISLKMLGIKKDWEKIHIDQAVELLNKENGKTIDLPMGIKVYREYDNILLEKTDLVRIDEIDFSLGEFVFGDNKLSVKRVNGSVNLKDGLYADLDKIPSNSVIRIRREGDIFQKFGGGTKKLGDYFTDRKIPLRLRDRMPILASDNQVLAVFGVAVSDLIKVDEGTTEIVKFTATN